MKKIQIYTAESKVKETGNVFKAMITGLISGRYIAYRLFLKNMKADYSKTYLGFFWDFAEPIILALVFILLRKGNVINFGRIDIPYSVFVVYGMLLFQTFSEGLIMPLDALARSKDLLSQTKIPPEAILMSLVFRMLYNAIFKITVLGAVSIILGAFSLTGFVLFILLFPAMILTGLSLGILLSVFNTVYNDISKLVRISIRPLLFASPVIYAIPKIKILELFNSINPISIIMSNLRMLATQNLWYDASSFWVTSILLVVIFLVGWFIFHLSVPIIVERI